MLCEYGLTPEYINDTWSEEKMALILRSRNKRIKRINEANNPKQENVPSPSPSRLRKVVARRRDK